MLALDMTIDRLSPKRDITGRVFGRLTPIKPLYSLPNRGVFWQCRCDCGKEAIVQAAKLRNGHTRSCGCAKAKHGHSGNGADVKPSPTYASWKMMLARCFQPSSPAFKHYKKRGITVCDRWLKFENFLADMGERPDGRSLDRWPDNDGNYAPGNCRWATKREQANNRITNNVFRYKGKDYTLAELSRHTGQSKETLRVRLVRPGGWDVKDAVETPTIPPHLRRSIR